MKNAGKNGVKSSLRSSKAETKRVSFSSASKEAAAKSPSPRKVTPEKPRKVTPEKPRRVSLKLFSKKKKKNGDKALVMDDKEESFVERDPVIEMLEARSTQKVRFSLASPEASGAAPRRPSAEKVSDGESPTSSNKSSRFSVKSFMSRNLFSKGGQSKLEDELNDPDFAEANKHSMLWKSAAGTSDFVHTSQSKGSAVMVAFTENPKTRAEVNKLLNKGRRAQRKYYKYEYAVKCGMRALELLNKDGYPDDHPTMIKTIEALNSAHHALSAYNNSANIVKIGIRCEDSGDLVRALKMYTIAYRIRRDSLSRSHPSLVVLLNLLGSIQVKRGELQEAMQVFLLALKDSPYDNDDDDDDEEEEARPPRGNLVARSITYRELGGIHEKLGNEGEAVKMYHKSLECATFWRELHRLRHAQSSKTIQPDGPIEEANEGPLCSLNNVKLSRTSTQPEVKHAKGEDGGMELFIGSEPANVGLSGDQLITDFYNSFFPPYDDKRKEKGELTDEDAMDMDIALTLHQIAQMYRRQGQHGRALDAYGAALRGMKHAVGPYDPRVAAILGNRGNLQNEMGDFDAAYDTYQEVLGIESYRLGFSHPEVATSIHNIATIEASRGNLDHALSLYQKVLALQKKLYGEDHQAVAVTAACMGDVHLKIGEVNTAMEYYEQAFKIKTVVFGRHHLEVARMLHKMGKVAFMQKNYNLADSYISRAFLLYRLNKLGEDHVWVVDAYKDGADVDAAIVMGGGDNFEC